MKTLKVYALRDVKADAFGPLMTVETKGLALRALADAVQNPQSRISQYPEDFMLYELGEYDPNSGELVPHRVPELVATVQAVIDSMKKAQLREAFGTQSPTEADQVGAEVR